MVGRQMIMVTWEGIWSDYRVRGGMAVPFTAQWRGCGRRAEPYFQGTVTALAYEFTR